MGYREQIENRLEKLERELADHGVLDEGDVGDDIQFVQNSTMGERVPEGAGDDARNRGTDDGGTDFVGDASLMGE